MEWDGMGGHDNADAGAFREGQLREFNWDT